MITRPDLRLARLAVDAAMDNVLTIIKSKKPEVLAAFSREQSMDFARTAYPALPPGATPTMFKPE